MCCAFAFVSLFRHVRTSSSDAIRQQRLSSAEARQLPPAAELVLQDVSLRGTAQPGCLATVLLVNIPLFTFPVTWGECFPPWLLVAARDARSGRGSRMCSRRVLPALPPHPRPALGLLTETASLCGLSRLPVRAAITPL